MSSNCHQGWVSNAWEIDLPLLLYAVTSLFNDVICSSFFLVSWSQHIIIPIHTFGDAFAPITIWSLWLDTFLGFAKLFAMVIYMYLCMIGLRDRALGLQDRLVSWKVIRSSIKSSLLCSINEEARQTSLKVNFLLCWLLESLWHDE